MRWSFRVARIGGIEIRIHVTFFRLLAWIGWLYHRSGGLPATIDGVLFVILIFVCVLLHELGHAIAAAHYGIKTPDITLLRSAAWRVSSACRKSLAGNRRHRRWPGGQHSDRRGSWGRDRPNDRISNPQALQQTELPMTVRLLAVNIWLVVFNAIPAFPMDGGRLVRALLAMRMN